MEQRWVSTSAMARVLGEERLNGADDGRLAGQARLEAAQNLSAMCGPHTFACPIPRTMNQMVLCASMPPIRSYAAHQQAFSIEHTPY